MTTHFDTHNRQFADDLPLAAPANCLKALGLLPSDLDAAFVTVVASCVPETMGKRISADGETIPPSNLVEGYAVLLPFASADEFSAILQAVEHNQAISPQRLAGDRWEAAVVTKGRLNNSPGLADAGVVARTKDHFEGKGRGVVIIDYDPPSDGDALTRDELWSALTNVAPGLKAGGAVWWCSSSSYLYEGDVERVGLRGQRIYLLVEDTSDTPRVLATLNVRLWAKGLGRVEVSVAGSLLVRCLADEAMGTAARLDYIGGMVCEGGWSQRRPAPVVLADGGFINPESVFA